MSDTIKLKFNRAYSYAPDVRTVLSWPVGEHDVPRDLARQCIEAGAAQEIKASAPAGGSGDLSGLKKAELVAYAEQRGVEIDAKATKADIIAAFEAG